MPSDFQVTESYLSFRFYRRSPLFPVSVVSRKHTCLCRIFNEGYQVNCSSSNRRFLFCSDNFHFLSSFFSASVSLGNFNTTRKSRILEKNSDTYLEQRLIFINICAVCLRSLISSALGKLSFNRKFVSRFNNGSWFDQSRLEI